MAARKAKWNCASNVNTRKVKCCVTHYGIKACGTGNKAKSAKQKAKKAYMRAAKAKFMSGL